jgi:hypothetical protein
VRFSVCGVCRHSRRLLLRREATGASRAPGGKWTTEYHPCAKLERLQMEGIPGLLAYGKSERKPKTQSIRMNRNGLSLAEYGQKYIFAQVSK